VWLVVPWLALPVMACPLWFVVPWLGWRVVP